MSNTNIITIGGRATRDAELKYTPAGIPVANFSLAVEGVKKNEDGSYKADFFNVTAWRNTAEYAGRNVGKGRDITVTGRMESRKYTHKDGYEVTVWDLIAENIQLHGPRPEGFVGTGGAEGEGAPAAAPAAARTRRPAPPTDESDDEDPFKDES